MVIIHRSWPLRGQRRQVRIYDKNVRMIELDVAKSSISLSASDNTMHFEVVTFDRIFDVQRKFAVKYSKSTHFSFESKGKPRYALEAYGWPNLREGDRVALAMLEPNNTQTLIGWKNLTTGEVVVSSAKREFQDTLMCCAIFPIGSLNLSGATSSAGRVAAWLFMICIVIGFLASVHKTIQRAQDARAIRGFVLPTN